MRRFGSVLRNNSRTTAQGEIGPGLRGYPRSRRVRSSAALTHQKSPENGGSAARPHPTSSLPTLPNPGLFLLLSWRLLLEFCNEPFKVFRLRSGSRSLSSFSRARSLNPRVTARRKKAMACCASFSRASFSAPALRRAKAQAIWKQPAETSRRALTSPGLAAAGAHKSPVPAGKSRATLSSGPTAG